MEPFDKEKCKWARWVKRLEGSFRMFTVPPNRHKDYLLHYMGTATYDLLCDHMGPVEPETKTYTEIVNILGAFFDPEPLEMVEVWKFRNRHQREGESMKEFVTELQRDAKFCQFGNYLNKELRNQLVFGMRSKRIRSRLIEEKALTFEKAVDIALSMEASGEGAELFDKRPHDVNYTERRSPKVTNITNKKCYRCGSGAHLANACRHKDTVCSFCKKSGHLQRVCLKFQSQGGQSKQSNDNKETKTKKKMHTNLINEGNCTEEEREDEETEVDEVLTLEICKVEKSKSLSKVILPLNVNKKIIKFEVDCGSPVSLMSLNDKKTYLNELPLLNTDVELISYCGGKIEVCGYVKAEVKHNGQTAAMRLFVVNTERHPLLGREWIRELNVDWNSVIRNPESCVGAIAVRNSSKGLSTAVGDLIESFPRVFDSSVGTIRGVNATLHLKPNSKPVFMKARTIPFAIRDTVEREIKSMVDAGILEKVERSAWATPVVPVMKSADRVRLCGDYKVTINKCLLVDEHPLPTIDELFSNMAGGQKFTKLDLAQAYLQMEVREEDRELLTLNTHLGLYKPTRLMYGVSSAPAIFQREISQLLGDIPGVSVFLDDIKVTGPDDETHLRRLKMVLQRLNEHGMRLNVAKCEFFADRIEYCGFVIDREGIRKMKAKVDAIQEMPRPCNREQVRAFVGLINYYGRFMPALSTRIYPINNLLKENVPFKWNADCEEAFLWVKKEMQSDRVLAHYDPKLPLVLATDASSYGVGAVLSHLYPDGTERPIHCASQTLNKSQQNYIQADKEAYAIVFGVKKFYQYLYGRKFILVTDNKAVAQIMAPNKGLPTLSALRMQHYAVFLESFDYEVRFRPSKENANADGMSRLPIEDASNKHRIEEVDLVEVNQIETLPVTVEELAKCTKEDLNVKTLLEGLKVGRVVEGCDRFGVNQSEFSIQQGCLMKGIRVYIPPKLRQRVLKELHTGHFGVSRMKSLARSYCWWGTVDRDIEDLSRDCCECASVRKNPVSVAPHCWEQATEPFQRIHVDFAGPFLGMYFFVIVDAFSKWPEVKIIRDMTTDTTIDRLREYFVTYGVPSVIVSDRGVQFTSDQFREFVRRNNIMHKMGAPYHPATNGQAERFVQTFKEKLKALKCERKDVQFELYKILMAYRRTVHPVTGKSPSMLVYGRQMKSRLDLLVPVADLKVSSRGEEEPVRCFTVYERVGARDFLGASKWQFGTVTERLCKLHYLIELDDGRIWKRHVDQIRAGPVQRNTEAESGKLFFDRPPSTSLAQSVSVGENGTVTRQQTPVLPTSNIKTSPVQEAASTRQSVERVQSETRVNRDVVDRPLPDKNETPRRSTRVRKPPKRLDL
ncbi:uncharacterized protein K02A2.6-like [Aedes albopictus]|uniref:RNA-directed DNA polymerase n=1 Tax=Aedes albopictus TaxID=7160 RepID=A0ABM1ZLS0_AEDAL